MFLNFTTKESNEVQRKRGMVEVEGAVEALKPLWAKAKPGMPKDEMNVLVKEITSTIVEMAKPYKVVLAVIVEKVSKEFDLALYVALLNKLQSAVYVDDAEKGTFSCWFNKKMDLVNPLVFHTHRSREFFEEGDREAAYKWIRNHIRDKRFASKSFIEHMADYKMVGFTEAGCHVSSAGCSREADVLELVLNKLESGEWVI